MKLPKAITYITQLCHILLRLYNCSCSTDRSWTFPLLFWHSMSQLWTAFFWHRIHRFWQNLGERVDFSCVRAKSFTPKMTTSRCFCLHHTFQFNKVTKWPEPKDHFARVGWCRHHEKFGIWKCYEGRSSWILIWLWYISLQRRRSHWWPPVHGLEWKALWVYYHNCNKE